MMIRFIFLALLFFSLFQLSAQEDTISKRLNHSLGVSAGATSGVGFSYRFLPNKWGVQVTGVPLFEASRTVFSAGLTALYRLREHKKWMCFYIWVIMFFMKNQRVSTQVHKDLGNRQLIFNTMRV